MAQHYFSEDPEVERREREVVFEVGGKVISAKSVSGTFSTSGLDQGTKVLLTLHEYFPKTGEVLDIGSGWGPIALSIASLCPKTKVFAVDVNGRAISQTKENASRLGLTNVFAYLPEQLDKNLEFDAIWSNPPIRIGKKALHALMRDYLPRLKGGGSAYLVVQKQLGAESFQKWLSTEFQGFEVSKVANSKGYRVIRATAPSKSL